MKKDMELAALRRSGRLFRAVRLSPLKRCFRRAAATLALLAATFAPFAVPSAFGKDCTISGPITVTLNNGTYAYISWFGNYPTVCSPEGGGNDTDTSSPSNNTLTVGPGVVIEGNSNKYFFGGNSSAATNNSLFIFDSTISGDNNISGYNYSNFYGGYSSSSAATNNSLFIFDSIISSGSSYPVGGYSSSSSAAATNNSLFIFDSIISSSSYSSHFSGGYSSGSATDNIIDISGQYNSFSTNMNLYGGNGSSATNLFTGNTLNLKSSGISVAGLYNFQYLNFTLPGGIATSTPMLTTNGLNYDTKGSNKPTLDIRTPGGALPNDSYILIRTSSAQTLDLIGAYSLYDAPFLNDAGTLKLTLPSSDRVQGTFKIELGNDDKDLRLAVNGYSVDNDKALTWTGDTNSRWVNYSTKLDTGSDTNPNDKSSPVENWKDSSNTFWRYLDGDAVTFTDIGSDPVFVIIGRDGVAPASVVFKNESTSYTLTGYTNTDSLRSGPLRGTTSLVKTGAGLLTLKGVNLHTGGTTVTGGGTIEFDAGENFGIYVQGVPKLPSNIDSLSEDEQNRLNQWKTDQERWRLANPHAGMVFLDKGTLQWATDTRTDISYRLGPIGENGGTFDTHGNDVTFNSPITGVTGDGGIIKKGSGTLTLKAANTYDGGTRIEGEDSTLEISGTLGSDNGDNYAGNIGITTGAELIFSNANAVQTLSGAITGGGNLTLEAGRLNLFNTATLDGSGTFTAETGTTLGLFAGPETTLEARSVDISGVNIDIIGYAPKDITGISIYPDKDYVHTLIKITGDTSLPYNIVSYVRVDGNTPPKDTSPSLDKFLDVYHIGKTEDEKELEIGLNLVWYKTDEYAHGTFNVSDTFTLNAALRGVAPVSNPQWTWNGKDLTKTGAGKLILNASNNSGGAVNVNAGSLVLNADNTIGKVDVNAGSLVLNAANIAGKVDVNAGSLIVGDADHPTGAQLLTAADAVTVYNGATLGGYGTVAGNVTISAGGILSPGNSTGWFTITETLTLEPGSLLGIEVDPARPYDPANEYLHQSSDRVIVTGTADLKTGTTVSHLYTDGTLGDYLATNPEAIAAGEAPDKKWLILEAASLVFEDEEKKEETLNTESNRYGLLPQLYYDPEGDPTHLYLWFLKEVFDNPLDNALPDEILDRFENLTEGERQAARDELSGDPHVTLGGLLLMRDDTFVRRLRRHVSTRMIPGVAVPSAGDGAWIRVDRSRATAEGGDRTARATWTGTEIAFGHDAEFSNGWLGGVAFGLDDGRQEVKDRRAEADVIRSTAALYGGREFPAGPGTLRLFLTGAVTRHDVESERHVRIGEDSQKLEARYDVRSFTGAFEAAYRILSAEKLFVEPYAALAWHHLRLDGFVEKGASAAALRRGGETWKRATSTLGLRFSTSPRERVSFDADVGWYHLYGNAMPKSAFTFREGSGVPFPARGAPLNKDAALLGLSVGVKLNDSARLRLQYDGELGSRGQSHEGQVVLEVNF